MSFHLYKSKSVLIVLVFMICSIPTFAFAAEDKTSKKDVKDADYYYNLGLYYKRLGKYQVSIDAFKQSIRINPDNSSAHLGLGISYIMIGDKDSALNEYKIIIDLNKEEAKILFNLIYP